MLISYGTPSTQTVAIGGDLQNPLSRLMVGLVLGSMMSSLFVAARTAPELGYVKRPRALQQAAARDADVDRERKDS